MHDRFSESCLWKPDRMSLVIDAPFWVAINVNGKYCAVQRRYAPVFYKIVWNAIGILCYNESTKKLCRKFLQHEAVDENLLYKTIDKRAEGILIWRLKTEHSGIRHFAVQWNWN